MVTCLHIAYGETVIPPVIEARLRGQQVVGFAIDK